MLERIALQKKLISKQDCLKAMAACKGKKNYESALKNYFIQNDLISETMIAKLIATATAIKRMKATIRFGSVAVKLGFITKEILNKALAVQKKALADSEHPRRIGEILVEQGQLTRHQLNEVIKKQKRINNNKRSKVEPVTPEPEPADTNTRSKELKPESEAIEGGMLLDIEDNGMTAFLRKTDQFDSTFVARDIHSIISAKGIQYGIVSEDTIQGFIDSSGFIKNRFKVAEGTPQTKGKNGRVEYYFDTDHLKAGNMDDKGNIDFKTRGEIPKIEANTLLAEKFSFEASQNGRDIFGNEIMAEPVSDTTLKALTGVLISEDGRYARAQISGHPKLDWSGNISVVDVFVANGDVGYKTGHLVYEGDIEVNGCLKSGFRIHGYDVKIKEIDGGEIHADGDITVLEGINGAMLHSRGHISTKYIHDSHISALGNVYVEKEIVDSTIETSGACQVKTGKIINSAVSSNQGVHAKDIGTDKTDPSTLTVGKDFFIKNELIRIEKQMIESEKQRKKLEARKEKLLNKNQEFQESAGRIANELDIVLIEKKDTRAQRLDKELNEQFDAIEKNEAAMDQINDSFDAIEDLIDDLSTERESYLDWSDSNPGNPVVTVDGTIAEGTLIQGCHSHKEIKETVSNVRIKESAVSAQGTNTTPFEIQIHDNIKKR